MSNTKETKPLKESSCKAKDEYLQLIINPGSTSTKLAIFKGAQKLVQNNLEHDAEAVSYTHLDVYKRQSKIPQESMLPAVFLYM